MVGPKKPKDAKQARGISERAPWAARYLTASLLVFVAFAHFIAMTKSSPALSAEAGTSALTFRVVGKIDHPEALGVAWSPDGRYLATVGLIGAESTRFNIQPKSASLWDMDSYRLVRTIKRTLGGGNTLVAFTADSAHVLFALPQDPSMPETTAFTLWNVVTGAIDRYVPSPYSKGIKRADVANAARHIAISPDGRYLAAVYGKADSGDPIGIYDTRTWSLISQNLKEERGVSALAFSPDSHHLAIGQYGGEIWIVDSLATKVVLKFKAHAPAIGSLAYSPDGTRIASGSSLTGQQRDHATGKLVDIRDDDPIRVWDASTGRLLHSYHGDFAPVRKVEWSPDGRYIVTASDSKVRLWDASSPKLLGEVARFDREAFTAAFDPRGGRLAAGGRQGIVVVEIREGKR
jgi:WD40 repeat protein